MENLIDIFAKLVAAALFIGIAWLWGKVKHYLSVKAAATGNSDLMRLVEEFCKAAEQEYKAGRLTAEARKDYVYELLTDASVEITNVVDALIEAAVYRINKEEA